MKRNAGFTLLEMMVAMSLMAVVVGVTLSALTSAMRATEGVTLMADTQENLRAAMNAMVRDLVQAGEGIPQGGITIPNTGGGAPASALTRPGPYTSPATKFGNFPAAWTALPAIAPGYQIGSTTTVSGVGTDMVTVLYADTSLVDSHGHWLNEYPIYLAPTAGVAGCAAANPNPAPAGSIVTAGTTTTVTFDASCINIGTGNTALHAGDLIMLQNNNTIGSNGTVTAANTDVSNSSGGTALVYVSSVNTAANSITFSTGDPYGLNNSGLAAGTISKIQSPPGSGLYPTTTPTRLWMVTYYIDNSSPSNPRLMRQVNLRTANAANLPIQPVGENIEHLQVYYDILNAGTSPATVNASVENPTYAQLAYIRDAYVTMYGRSQSTFSQTKKFFRNNLTTVVSIRSLNFYNEFN